VQVARWMLAVSVAGAVGSGALAGCGSADAPASIRMPVDTSIEIVLAAHTLEPTESTYAEAALVWSGARHIPSPSEIVWTSSDRTIATVDAGLIVGGRPGTVTITARVGGRSASEDISVEWRPDATLGVRLPDGTIAVGARFQLTAFVRDKYLGRSGKWSSGDTQVATVDSLGVVTALAVGHVTIRVEFAGLIGAAAFDVNAAPTIPRFGYVYSYSAPSVDDYEGAEWSPPSDQGYSTSAGLRLTLLPPYPVSPDLGWTGRLMPAPGALLHVVPFDLAPCAAYFNTRQDFTWLSLGAPQVDCFDQRTLRSSYRMEFVALTPDAFTGTLALVRPGMPSVMSNGAAIRDVDNSVKARDYEATGFTRDSLYWFVSSASPLPATCSVAPASATPTTAMARIVCRNSLGVATEPVAFSIGFGTDAARGSNPRGFAELDSLGNVLRASTTTGLAITATRSTSDPSPTFDVSISGARVAEFERLPAVFLTPVSSSAPGCTMNASRVSETRVRLRVTCAFPVDGLLIGVTY
jgi:Big-like domain-containing protein